MSNDLFPYFSCCAAVFLRFVMTADGLLFPPDLCRPMGVVPYCHSNHELPALSIAGATIVI
jgi:hypothetical protein